MDSIGEVLRQERERRGLSLQEAHEATKITVQSLTALEGDRFESFPNKVYARAFLRDYANFLSLDSAQLLTSYEERWSPTVDAGPVVEKSSGGSARVFGYVLAVVVLVGALGAGGYLAWPALKRQMHSHKISGPKDHGVAVLPQAPRVAPPKPESAPKPVAKPQPEPAAVPDKAVLQVTAILPVWIGVKVDGQTVFQAVLPKGQTKTFEGKKTVFIRAGMAGAVQLKFNGQPQPSMGTFKSPGEKEFALPSAPAQTPAGAATAVPAPGASPTSATATH